MRVLLVDKESSVRALVHTALQIRGGFEVVGEAGTGRDAIDLVRSLAPDVVVLGRMLPDIGGDDVAEQIRHEGGGPRVMVYSSYDPKDMPLSVAVGAYVTKDDDLQIFLEAIALETLR